jgi:hypothetical protein
VRDESVKKKKAHLLGIGLDNEDGHKRITQAESFSIVGGSQETHERITETVVKTFEDIKKAGKELENIERKHLAELIEKNRPA